MFFEDERTDTLYMEHENSEFFLSRDREAGDDKTGTVSTLAQSISRETNKTANIGTKRVSVDMELEGKTNATQYFNLTNLVWGTLYFNADAPGSKEEEFSSVWFRLEFFADSIRIGARDYEYYTSSSGSRAVAFELPIEQRLIPKDSQLVLRFTLLSGATEFVIKTQDEAYNRKTQSWISYAYFTYDPLSTPIYLENGEISPAGGNSTTSAPEAERSATVIAAGLVFLITVAASAGRRRGLTTIILATLLLSSLAGCASKARPSGELEGERVPVRIDEGKEKDPALASHNRGSIRGWVRDGGKANMAIVGAKLYLEATNLVAFTNRSGSYAFENVTPFTYVLVLEAGPEFKPVRVNLTVEPGLILHRNFTMYRDLLPGCTAACTSHTHDGFWEGKTEKPLFVGDVTLPGAGATVNVPIELGGDHIVGPGATQLRLEAQWTPTPSIQEVGFKLQTPFRRALGSTQPWYEKEIPLMPRSPGVPHLIAFYPNFADAGHAPATRWIVDLTVPAYGVVYAADAVAGNQVTVAVKVIAVKGISVIEARHPDFWGNATVKRFIDPVAQAAPVAAPGQPPKEPRDWNEARPTPGLVPTGSKEIVGKFWRTVPNNLGAVAPKYDLLYKSPILKDWQPVPDRTAITDGFEFRLKVEDKATDGMYDEHSAWRFAVKLVEEGGAHVFVSGTQVYLEANLTRHPDYAGTT